MLSPVLAGEKTRRRDRHQSARLVRRQRHRTDRRRCRSTAIDRAAQDRHGRERPQRALRQAADRHRLASRWRRRFPVSACPASAPSATSPMSSKMIAAARTHQRAVVIGGGLLGLEAAWGLKQRGMSVAVVHLMPTLMERQLDAAAGQLLQRDLDRRGIAFFTDGQTEEILGSRARRGRAARRRPRRSRPISWCWPSASAPTSISPSRPDSMSIAASSSTTTCAPAIPTSTRSANASSIAARCSAWSRRCGTGEGLRRAARRRRRRRVHVPQALSTSLKITGIDVFSAGALIGRRRERRRDHAARRRARHLQEARAARRQAGRRGALRRCRRRRLVSPADARQGTTSARLRDGSSSAAPSPRRAGASRPAPDVAAMPDDAQICGCNGVSKGAIVDAITDKELTTLDEVRAHTKASASCGQCTGHGRGACSPFAGGRSTPSRRSKPMCKCTDARP